MGFPRSTNLAMIGIVALLAFGILARPSHAKIDPETVVGMWLFDEDKGNVAEDSSGNEHKGTLNGGPKRVEGKFGQALNFNGVSHVSLGQVDFFTEGQQTLAIWAKPEKNPPAVRGFLFAHPAAGEAANRVYIIQHGSGNFIFQGGDLTTYTIFAGAKYAAGEWLHIVVTRDHEDQKLGAWVNGVETIVNQAAVWSSTATVTSQIGAVNGGEPFEGIADEVAIFSTILSEPDIKSIYEKGLAEAINPSAVEPVGKLAATWADIKAQIAE